MSVRRLPSWAWLMALGLLLRLPGLLFGGMADVYEFVLDWGADVRALGLVQGFSINYGALSFAAFGLAARLGEELPRFWWLPYKLLVLACEGGVLWALLRLVDRRSAALVLVAYWLNPWFIWHGAYQGFWDGAHLLMALVAVLALRASGRDAVGWTVVGALLFASWQFKPQGLVHFAVPVGLLLGAHALRRSSRPLMQYAAGFLAVLLLVSVGFAAAGGSVTAVVDNFRSSSGDARWSNGGVGLWRFAAFVYMQAHGLAGEVHALRLPVPLLAAGNLVAAALVGSSLAALAWRMTREGRSLQPADLYVMLAAGALVVAQFGTRAHINHTYGALVLLIPLLPAGRLIRAGWLGAVVIQALAHVARYQMGAAALLPPDGVITRYGHAAAIADGVRALPAAAGPDLLLRFQLGVNERLAALPGPDVFSALGLPMTICAMMLVIGLFRLTPSRAAALVAGREGHA